jgi:hypothetical protein
MSAQAGPRCRGMRTAFLRITTISTFFYDAARCFGFTAYDFLPGPGKRDYSRPHLVSERETFFRLLLFFLTMFSFSFYFLYHRWRFQRHGSRKSQPYFIIVLAYLPIPEAGRIHLIGGVSEHGHRYGVVC